MDRTYRFRNSILVFLIFLVAVIFLIRLFALQLSETEETGYSASDTTTYIQYVPAARGEILDRHGTVLVSNRATYSVTLQHFVLFNSDDPNGYLLSLAQTCIKNGIEYEESLPLTLTEPYDYRKDELSGTENYIFKIFLLSREWDADMTAENLYKRLRDTYNISDEYTDYEARLIMGLRYELDLPIHAYTDVYTVAEDVTAEELAILKELGIPGMDVEATTVREFNTRFAAQLLGNVGLMTAEEYEGTYEALDYSMNASVGKDGFEYAFEEYLHGVDGQKAVTVTSDGTVVNEEWVVEPQSGSNVITTIDIRLQEIAETALADAIEELKASKEEGQSGYDVDSGACVVMDVNSGEVLASANYPTYDPADYAIKYDELREADGEPLANRALIYPFPPGSTFKMITALAGLRNGFSPATRIEDTGLYMKYADADFTPKCWIYGESGIGHGVLDMRGAIANSCNIYFYTIGDTIGINPLQEVAESFGVGKYTGSEVPEDPGTMASEELKEALYVGQEEGWYAADTVTAAIGQSLTTMTPLQMCRYTVALANKGTLYDATFLRRIVSSDFQTLVKGNDYTPAATGLISEYEHTIIKEGMRLCATEGTAKKYLADYQYEVCAKTGTAEHGSGGSDNGAFVCWAPMDNPEIAIAIYVEHGDSGGYYSNVAMDIMDYYFNTKDQAQELEIENNYVVD